MPLPTALEKVVGKPWSAWVSLTGSDLPSDPPVMKHKGEIVSSGAKRNNHYINNEFVDPTNTHSRRLNRSEMAIFGGCPASDKFILIPCSYCGDKFKCPALADHIRLRHAGAEKPLIIGSPNRKKSSHVKTKGKHGRFSKDEEKLIEPPTVVEEVDMKSQDLPKNKPEVQGNHRNVREISITKVIRQLILNKSGSKLVKESNKSSRESKAKIKKPRVLEPSLPVINNVPPPLKKSPAPQKRESKLKQPGGVGKFTLPVSIKNPNLWSQLQAPTEPITPPYVDKISKSPFEGFLIPGYEVVTLAYKDGQTFRLNSTRDSYDKTCLRILSIPVKEPVEVLSKKAKLDQTGEVAALEESKIQSNTTVSAQPPPPGPPKLTLVVKLTKPRKKKVQKSSTMRGGRVYDADNHCGVTSKENSCPCTPSLSCNRYYREEDIPFEGFLLPGYSVLKMQDGNTFRLFSRIPDVFNESSVPNNVHKL